MTRIFTTKNSRIEEISAPEEGCWISLVKPDEGEISVLAQHYAIDPDLLLSLIHIYFAQCNHRTSGSDKLRLATVPAGSKASV